MKNLFFTIFLLHFLSIHGAENSSSSNKKSNVCITTSTVKTRQYKGVPHIPSTFWKDTEKVMTLLPSIITFLENHDLPLFLNELKDFDLEPVKNIMVEELGFFINGNTLNTVIKKDFRIFWVKLVAKSLRKSLEDPQKLPLKMKRNILTLKNPVSFLDDPQNVANIFDFFLEHRIPWFPSLIKHYDMLPHALDLMETFGFFIDNENFYLRISNYKFPTGQIWRDEIKARQLPREWYDYNSEQQFLKFKKLIEVLFEIGVPAVKEKALSYKFTVEDKVKILYEVGPNYWQLLSLQTMLNSETGKKHWISLWSEVDPLWKLRHIYRERVLYRLSTKYRDIRQDWSNTGLEILREAFRTELKQGGRGTTAEIYLVHFRETVTKEQWTQVVQSEREE